MSKAKPVFDLWNPAAAPENWARFSVKAKDGVIAGICAEDGVGVIWFERQGDELLVQFRGYLLVAHQPEWVGKIGESQSLKIGMTSDQIVTAFVDDKIVFACRINKPSYRGLNFQFFTGQKVTDLEIYNGERRADEKNLADLSAEVTKAGQDYWVGLINREEVESRLEEAKLQAFAFFADSQEKSDLFIKIGETYTLVRHVADAAPQQ